VVLVKLPRQLSIRNVGADEGRDRQGGRRAEEEGDLPDSADVLDSVGGAKSKVLRGQQQVTSLMSNGLPTHVYQRSRTHLVQPEPDVVSIQPESMQLALQQVLLQSSGNGRLHTHKTNLP
jgi:hypothetical protein